MGLLAVSGPFYCQRHPVTEHSRACLLEALSITSGSSEPRGVRRLHDDKAEPWRHTI